MEKHVFVAAVSTFLQQGKDGITQMPETTYQFVDKSLEEDNRVFVYTGHYQLEPIPVFISEKFGKFTDVILLETPDTYDPAKDGRTRVFPAPDGKGSWPSGIPAEIYNDLCDKCQQKFEKNKPGVAADWYKEWLKLRFPDITIHDLPINQHEPARALEDTIKLIRELYETTSTEEWRLWIDTHGGFRVVSEVLASAVRMLSVGKEPIPTDGIFTIFYSQKKNTPSEIVNLTPFYFTESTKALEDYLNYGQYLNMQFKPCDGKDPFAFVSYRHDRNYLTSVRTVFGKLQENGVEYWFDDGIHTGDNWKTILQNKNHDASVFIALLTNSYFDSPECWKELIQAIANSKKGEKDFFFIILEEKLTLPNAIPTDEKFKPVRELQKELLVTDEDILNVLNSDIQQIQGYKYMYENEKTQINMRNLHDEELNSDLQKIRNALKNASGQGSDK